MKLITEIIFGLLDSVQQNSDFHKFKKIPVGFNRKVSHNKICGCFNWKLANL